MDNIVVLDYGSKNFKAGYSYSFPSEDEPRVVIPNAVDVQSLTSGNDARGDAATTSSDPDIHFPVRQGRIQNFDHFEALVHHILYDLLNWRYGEEGSMIVSEPLLTPKPDRERLAQLMFEVFNVNGLFVQDQPVLSLYAVGKLSGCVADLGHGKVDVSTVVEGQLTAASGRRLPLAGEDLTYMLAKLLQHRGVQLNNMHVVETLKEQCCQAADSGEEYEATMARAGSTTAASAGPQPSTSGTFTLPDGQEIVITTEGLTIAEALFCPSIAGESGPGLAEMAYDCIISQPDISSRKQSCETLLVCGGGSSIGNLPARLHRDVRALLPPSMQPSLCPVPEYMQQQQQHILKNAPWVGGAVLSKVIIQQNHFVSKADYDELGPCAIHKKCN